MLLAALVAALSALVVSGLGVTAAASVGAHLTGTAGCGKAPTLASGTHSIQSSGQNPLTGFLAGVTLPDGSNSYVESDIGGTSLACPLFEGLQADAIQAQGGQDLGLANPAIYARSGGFAITDVTATGPGTRVGNVIPPAQGTPAITVTFGDDQLLKAGRGYDDATGVGTPSPFYLWSYLTW